MQRSLRLTFSLVAWFMIPVVCLSMGGCPPQGGGGDAVCGNGSVESGEDCDDGNTTAGDGCSATCQDEDVAGVCGDGRVDAGEECDDGNTERDDGCSATCQNEDTPTPTDSDGDGVPDEIDECPGTGRGTEVDAVGCPEDSPANDSDNDGVSNDDDDCPNSPQGAPVDATGCAANQRDTDGDGLPDNIDACVNIPAGDTDEDEDGCPDSAPGTPDDDEDGVPNDVDRCDNTPAGQAADAEGCSASQRDTDNDGINDAADQCPTQPGPAPSGCPGGSGNGAVCGNGAVEAGEECDDGDTTSGDGCSSSCQIEGSGIANDNCAGAVAVGEGTRVFSTVVATTDGPLELEQCTFFGRSDIRSDIWYCYTAACTGPAVISLCGSGYDTKLAVYSGCECPTTGSSDRVLACSDDDCGAGTENAQSRVIVNVVSGQSYLVRVGGFFGNREQGEGRLTIRCGEDTCVNGSGSCTTAHADNEPGCDTPTCCNRVCDVDTFCCDVTWDAFCASQAEGFCSTTGFPSCNAQAGGCNVDQTSPGCNNAECCNAVCESDPFCCIREWDENCVGQADLICASCGRGRGECDEARTEPGCNDISCCAKVCAVDAFCCNSEWDQTCADQAADLCGR